MSNSRVLNSSRLVESIRNAAMIPDDRHTYTDEVLLDIANQEIDVSLLAILMSLNEEHMVTSVDIPYDGQQRVKIPYRAVANKLRDVSLLQGDRVYELSRISLEEVSDYDAGFSTDYLQVFYVEGDEIVLLGATNAETIRMHYYLRPNVLVEVDRCGKIFDIDEATGTVQLYDFPKDFSNIPEMDFVQGRTPNKILNYDILPVSVDSNTRTVVFNPEDLPKSLRKGDYLCNAGETPVPNLPTEMHPLLAQYAAIYILEGLGDTQGLANANNKLERIEMSLQTILNDRIEGSPQKINARHSTLVQTGIRNGRRRR